MAAEGAVQEDPTTTATICRWNCWICPQQLQRGPPSSGTMGSGDSVILIITSSDYSVQVQESQSVQFLLMRQLLFFTFSLTSQVLFERQRPEEHSWDSACQAFLQNKISCKRSFLFCPLSFCHPSVMMGSVLLALGLLLMTSEQSLSFKWQLGVLA